MRFPPNHIQNRNPPTRNDTSSEEMSGIPITVAILCPEFNIVNLKIIQYKSGLEKQVWPEHKTNTPHTVLQMFIIILDPV